MKFAVACLLASTQAIKVSNTLDASPETFAQAMTSAFDLHSELNLEVEGLQAERQEEEAAHNTSIAQCDLAKTTAQAELNALKEAKENATIDHDNLMSGLQETHNAAVTDNEQSKSSKQGEIDAEKEKFAQEITKKDEIDGLIMTQEETNHSNTGIREDSMSEAINNSNDAKDLKSEELVSINGLNEIQNGEITLLNDDIDAVLGEVENLTATTDSMSNDLTDLQQAIADLGDANADALQGLDADIETQTQNLQNMVSTWEMSISEMEGSKQLLLETDYAALGEQWRNDSGIIDKAVEEETALLSDELYEVCTEVTKEGDNNYSVHTETRKQ